MRPPVAPPTQRPPRPPRPPRARLAPLATVLATILATGLALGLARTPEAAAHTAPELEWHAPAGCPDQARVLEHIHRVVGPALATADALTRVQARVEPHGDAWQLVVVFTGRDATRERRLTLRDCESTANATALLVAIAIAGAAPTAPIARELPPALAIESPHSESTPPAPILAPEPISTPAPVVRPPPRAAPRLLLQAGPAVAVGILPRVTPGLQLALGAAWPRLRLTLGYARWFRSPARLAARPEVGTDLSLHLATVRLGPVRSFGPLALQPQLGLEFGALRAQGIGSAVTFDRRSWWGAALLGAALAWAPRALRGRGALLLQTDLVLALHRPAFTLGPAVPIFRLGPVGLRLALLLEARLF